MTIRQRILRAIGAVDQSQHVTALESVNRLAQIRNDEWQRGNVRSELLDLSQISAMAEASGINGTTGVKLKEYIRDLEIVLENQNWQRQQAVAVREFSRWGIQQIILMSQLYFIKNPLIRRGIKVSSYYVFGRGVEITSDDATANTTIKEFLEDPDNANELGHSGLVQKEETLHTDGNIFFVFFSDKSTGAVKVRTIAALEIQDIVCDPDDASRPWYYHRTWTQNQFDASVADGLKTLSQECWYPDADYQPATRPNNIGGKPIMWDTPIIHSAVGKLPKWKFGVPDVYAALDWARAVKDYLEDWSTIQRANRRIAMDIETKGGLPAIAAYQAALGTTAANQTNMGWDSNPPPVTGAAHVHGIGTTVKAFQSRGATDGPEEARRLVLMVCAVFGLPETFFGDASTGSLATAKSLDRPTELKFLEAQERWRMVLGRICHYVLRVSASAPSGKIREALKEAATEKADTIKVNVRFPSVLEHDVMESISALVAGATLNGLSPAGTIDIKSLARKLNEELGYDNVEEILDEIYPDAPYKAMMPKMFPVSELDGTQPDPALISTDPLVAPQKPQQKGARPPRPVMNQESIPLAVAELRKAVKALAESRKAKEK